ncbi:MAG: hypothetical protein R2698_03865 [Microthrixaceae bacterium]
MSPATLPAISHAVRRMTTIFSWAVLVIATATLVGWATSVVGLRTGRLFETPVAPNTAVSLVVLAFCVTRLQDLRPARRCGRSEPPRVPWVCCPSPPSWSTSRPSTWGSTTGSRRCSATATSARDPRHTAP